MALVGIIITVLVLFIFKNEKDNGTINMNIKVLDDLKISADGLSYESELTRDDFNIDESVYNNRNQLPDTLSRISTTGGITNGKLDLFYETIKSKKNDYFVSSEKQNDEKCFSKDCTDASYMVYDLFFDSDSPETIALTSNSYVKQKDDNGLENAIRVGFIVEGTTSSKDIKDVYDLEAGIKTIIWEPNSDMHTQEAINFVKDMYDEDLENRKLYYRGINSNFENLNIKEIKTSNNYSDVMANIVTEKDFKDSQRLFTIQQGVTKVRVYIWLESGDSDAMFEKELTNLDINLEFEIAK